LIFVGLYPSSAAVRRIVAIVSLASAGLIATPHGAPAQIRDHMYAVSRPTAAHAWVAGAFGSIFHTADGGASWQEQLSGTDEHLFGVGFADARVGWVVGRSGIVRHTADGGASWQAQASPAAGRHLFKVAAVDVDTAVAIGDWGTVIATTDRGRTWHDRSLDRDVILNGQDWLSRDVGWLVGEAGAIYATTDGGVTWVERDSGVFKSLFAVSFVDRRRGWAAGLDGLILTTGDGGESWSVLRGSPGVEAFEEVDFDETFLNPTLFDIAVRGRFGIAVGDLGAVFVSADGGQTWERQALDGDAGLRWLRAVTIGFGGDGLVVGARGLVLPVQQGRVEVPQAAAEASREP